MTLDEEISSAFALLGLLLVFVTFAAFFPFAQELLGRPAPNVAADETTC